MDVNGKPSQDLDASLRPQTFQFQNPLASENTRKKFCALYIECLETLSDTFPEFSKLKGELDRFRSSVFNNAENEDQCIKQWHNGMVQKVTVNGEPTNMYDLSDAHSGEFWANHVPFLSDVDISNVISSPNFYPESMDVLWEYVNGMNKHARIYNAIPENMFNKIRSTATEYIDKMTRGEMKFSLEDLNLEELKTAGQALTNSFAREDLDQFMSNISGVARGFNINNLQDVMKMVTDIPGMGDMMRTLNNGGGDGGGGPNIGGLINQLFQNGGQDGQELLKDIDKMFPSNQK